MFIDLMSWKKIDSQTILTEWNEVFTHCKHCTDGWKFIDTDLFHIPMLYYKYVYDYQSLLYC